MLGYIILGVVVGMAVAVIVGYCIFLHYVKKAADKSPFGG